MIGEEGRDQTNLLAIRGDDSDLSFGDSAANERSRCLLHRCQMSKEEARVSRTYLCDELCLDRIFDQRSSFRFLSGNRIRIDEDDSSSIVEQSALLSSPET